MDIQKHRSFVHGAGGEGSSKNDDGSNASKLMRTVNLLSDRIDDNVSGAGTDGLPEDRVAAIILKSARSKLEWLVRALEN